MNDNEIYSEVIVLNRLKKNSKVVKYHYLQDYPSVGQLAMQLEKNNIQPIFAVTENVASVYKVNVYFSISVKYFQSRCNFICPFMYFLGIV